MEATQQENEHSGGGGKKRKFRIDNNCRIMFIFET